MTSGIAAKRYAKGLLQLAIEQNTVNEQLKDMQFIRSTFKDSKGLQIALSSPVIKDSKKQEIVEQIFSAHVSALTNRLIEVMSRKGRLDLLNATTVNFENLHNEYAGILEVTLTTAFELEKSQVDSVIAEFSKVVGLKIKSNVIVDKSLIGGLTLKYRDTVVDGSVRNKLEQLSQSLQSQTV
ncbi:MAG: ATP synthase F1 subunit delta [Bacteroidetes bacterium]|nr:ATP synthase F1 subunit delta [Bacteroidota bacterium]MCH8523448.1 ATP synthase F1 subunit delta [Balneolales bacterium]